MKMENSSAETPKLLGDVVISVETAERESQVAGMVLEDRFDQLLIHGILHLFGYDHEQSREKAHEMQKKSKEMLKLVKTKAAKSKLSRL
jgi:probable rRNA maturation factor